MSNTEDGILPRLLEQNARWLATMALQHPGVIEEAAREQKPTVLWIGCADSRVPESVILGSMPGEIFTHRNIAHQVPLDDHNVQSVLTFAIGTLKVQHIIVAGHTSCGGVAVCLDEAVDKKDCFNSEDPPEATNWPPPAPMDSWLASLRDMADRLPRPTTVQDLEKANIQAQINNVLESPAVKAQWAQQAPTLVGVHGWLYDIHAASVRDLGISVYNPNRGI